MTSETRNQLLTILSMVKAKEDKDKKRNLDWLLERYEINIKDQLKELRGKEAQLKEDLELLQYVKEEIEK